ncbi:MAG: hypothetical protein QOH21_1173 [Acidobacteriota bacterium]|jgi:lysine-specific demethylase 8|nr:hypothetical protein [Acidobacteriota bacterium]
MQMHGPIVGGIERVENPDRELFTGRYVAAARPVILTGAFDGWPARRTWSPSALRERLGAIPVTFKEARGHLHPELDEDGTTAVRGRSTLAEYLDRVVAGDSRVYLTGDEMQIVRAGQINTALAPLWTDFALPPLFALHQLDSIGLWLSAAGVVSRLHFDANGAHNLNAQVVGRKHVVLFPPSEAPYLYLYDAPESKARNFSRIDIDAVDGALFPEFRQAHGFEGVLHEGEMLFLPAGWFHSFRHEGAWNANVNFWWRD